MQVQFLGSGDAFGSGGRFNSCFLVTANRSRFLIECGASSLVAMRRFGVDPNSVQTILISHLHGDHFGGLPIFLLDAQFVSRRESPLVIAGPPGLGRRLGEAQECLFPGSSKNSWRFDWRIEELEPGRRWTHGDIAVTPHQVVHACGAPPFALRVEADGKVVTYSGDTEWTDALIAAARGADLFIAEAYSFEKKVPFHLDYATLLRHVDEIRAKRLILTHMGRDMLDRVDRVACECAEDGMIVTVD